MAITLDTIVSKTFKDAKNGYGYDKNEVEAFLDEILEEMENREAQTNQLKEQAAALSRELDEARAQLAARPAAQAISKPSSAPVKPMEERHATESFELVLTKAKGAYEEIVSAADARADEIIRKATEDASAIRSNAEGQIADLTAKLGALRKQAGSYCDALKKMIDEQNASMDQVKKLL